MKTVYRRSVTTRVTLSIVKQILVFLLSISILSLLNSCKSNSNGILGKQTAESTTEDPDIKNAPFAFDIVMDTISYNSCVNNDNSGASSPIHGIKIGANEGVVDYNVTQKIFNYRSGLKLRSEFLLHVGQKFTPSFPNDTINGDQLSKILTADYSVLNSNAYMQVAIRKKSDLTIVPDQINPPANATVSAPTDVIVFPQKFNEGFLAYSLALGLQYSNQGQILKEGPRIYNLSDTQIVAPIEAQLAFNKTSDETFTAQNPAPIPTEQFGSAEAYGQKVRDNFTNSNQILAVTFGGVTAAGSVITADPNAATVNTIKRPNKLGTSTPDPTKAYGKGYYLKFESKTSVTTWPKILVTQVSEINLESGQSVNGASWSCNNFPIVPANYWNNNRASNSLWVKDGTHYEPSCIPLLPSDTTCDLPTDPDCAAKNIRAQQIKNIRRHYNSDNWNIGLMFYEETKSGGTGIIFSKRKNLGLCISPINGSCYLRTTNIIAATSNPPSITDAEEMPKDVGIQFDRTKDCYLTTGISTDKNAARKNGRCGNFASICVRSSSN